MFIVAKPAIQLAYSRFETSLANQLSCHKNRKYKGINVVQCIFILFPALLSIKHLILLGLFLTKNEAFLTQNRVFLTQNGALLTQNGVFLTQNEAFLTQNEVLLTQNETE